MLPVVLLMTVSVTMAIRIKTAGHARSSTGCNARGSTNVSAVVGSSLGRTMVRGAVVGRAVVATVAVAVAVMVFVLLLFLVFLVTTTYQIRGNSTTNSTECSMSNLMP